jgi:prophage antirepressor-like protein
MFRCTSATLAVTVIVSNDAPYLTAMDAAPVLDFAKHVFDLVALAAEDCVVGFGHFAVRL